jgi:hypothetical protein
MVEKGFNLSVPSNKLPNKKLIFSFPNMRGHEGYPERDYTPQGKMAEEILRKWYR